MAFALIIAAMSLNLVLGYAGLISLGHSAFFGIGGYTTAILVKDHGWSPGWTFYAAAAIAFVIGCIVALPALRLKGVYLALVTLAVAVLFPQLMKWRKLEWLTNGAQGIDSVRYEDVPTWPIIGELRGREGRTEFAYWLAFVVLVIAYLVCSRHREEPGRPVAGGDPGQRDGGRGDGREPVRDEDARVRRVGRAVRHGGLALDVAHRRDHAGRPVRHAARLDRVPAGDGHRRRRHALGPDRRWSGLRAGSTT